MFWGVPHIYQSLIKFVRCGELHWIVTKCMGLALFCSYNVAKLLPPLVPPLEPVVNVLGQR